MPEDHQKYLEWNGDRFRQWAGRIGENTHKVIDGLLTSKPVEQQAYRSCMGLLKLVDKYSADHLETACKQALTYTASPSYKSIKNILTVGKEKFDAQIKEEKSTNNNKYGITRGADYYRR